MSDGDVDQSNTATVGHANRERLTEETPMRRAFVVWWNHGCCRRWGWRDYLLHFGIVSLVTLVGTMHWISIMTQA